MHSLPWIILFAPLLAAAGITLFTLRNPARSALLSVSAVAVAFVLSVVAFLVFPAPSAPVELSGVWLAVGSLQVEFGVRLDPLSLVMLLIVTGVGGVIHVYSCGYMRGDRGTGRYFACLSFFTFSMLLVVLATNFLQLFIGWELVGLSSYLLIGFWYERESAAEACKKAFLTNRLGDVGFLLGIILVWATLGSLHFGELAAVLETTPGALGAVASLAGLLVFCGAMGKSAQFPLHVWLPDAMEGPTPVSALIHAATMVAAGVYLLCRVFFLLEATPAWPDAAPAWLDGITALGVVGWIGGVTALLAALIAVQQDDIKRILAYSTLSQLGYMMMAVGLSAPVPAMFHLATHAFFKALLFLGAGAVIVSLHHEQNIWRMGGLHARMPATAWTFLIATLALCGVPPFSGFFSKDAILAAALDPARGSGGLFLVGVAVAFLTAFYMTRLVLVTFQGTPRSAPASEAVETSPVMKWPLVVLAVPAALAGFWSIDRFLDRHFHPAAAAPASGWFEQWVAPLVHAPLAVLLSLVAVGLGFYTAYLLYRGAATDPLPAKLGLLARGMRAKFYLDELNAWCIRLTHDALARLADWIDRWIIAGVMVRGTHGTTELVGRALRLVQSGNLQTYVLVVVLGIAAVLWLALGPRP
ncbi:MAG: NADH-quinone oxidoreductase subunit L [Verrucomicrobia bacterium]|nr:NADH-quinone oxidoreductase subunit L [Verrucomicrobiota bacterium]